MRIIIFICLIFLVLVSVLVVYESTIGTWNSLRISSVGGSWIKIEDRDAVRQINEAIKSAAGDAKKEVFSKTVNQRIGGILIIADLKLISLVTDDYGGIIQLGAVKYRIDTDTYDKLCDLIYQVYD